MKDKERYMNKINYFGDKDDRMVDLILRPNVKKDVVIENISWGNGGYGGFPLKSILREILSVEM